MSPINEGSQEMGGRGSSSGRGSEMEESKLLKVHPQLTNLRTVKKPTSIVLQIKVFKPPRDSERKKNEVQGKNGRTQCCRLEARSRRLLSRRALHRLTMQRGRPWRPGPYEQGRLHTYSQELPSRICNKYRGDPRRRRRRPGG